MNAEDRRRMLALRRSLAAVEVDSVVTDAALAAAVDAADRDRLAAGREPLRLDDVPPEEEFYRRARALGFRRRRG